MMIFIENMADDFAFCNSIEVGYILIGRMLAARL